MKATVAFNGLSKYELLLPPDVKGLRNLKTKSNPWLLVISTKQILKKGCCFSSTIYWLFLYLFLMSLVVSYFYVKWFFYSLKVLSRLIWGVFKNSVKHLWQKILRKWIIDKVLQHASAKLLTFKATNNSSATADDCGVGA